MITTSCENPMCECPSCRCVECRCGTASMGDLEGRVMDVLWSRPESEATVKEVTGAFPDLAYTTVATMLDRLAEKGLARCRLDKHTRHYAANGSRAAYTAMAMCGSLRNASEPGAALERFVEVLSPAEIDMLRVALRRTRRRSGTAG